MLPLQRALQQAADLADQPAADDPERQRRQQRAADIERIIRGDLLPVGKVDLIHGNSLFGRVGSLCS
ncbi:hypothetical protein D3C85_1903640 [compost metagenome]